jgi:hypothetical protein
MKKIILGLLVLMGICNGLNADVAITAVDTIFGTGQAAFNNVTAITGTPGGPNLRTNFTLNHLPANFDAGNNNVNNFNYTIIFNTNADINAPVIAGEGLALTLTNVAGSVPAAPVWTELVIGQANSAGAFSQSYLSGGGAQFSYFRVASVLMQYTDGAMNLISVNAAENTVPAAHLDAAPEGPLSIVKTAANTNYPTTVAIDITYPDVLVFNGFANKFGISLFGLTCPQNINVHVAAVDPTVALGATTLLTGNPLGTLNIPAVNVFANIIYSYPLPGQFGAIAPPAINPGANALTQIVYYYEYQDWVSPWPANPTQTSSRYSPAIYVATTAANYPNVVNNTFAVYYSNAQGVFGNFNATGDPVTDTQGNI